MKCLNCGHSATQHNLDSDRRCRVRTVTDWSTQRKEYTGARPCECTCYRGIDPTADVCAHEFLLESNNPNACVHCGQVKAEKNTDA